MNYQQTLEQYVMQINNELADLQSLNVNEIMTKLQSLINTGYQQYIIETIRSCILHYQNDRAIIKYGYIADKLIKLPVFNQMVQNVIVQFFCDIFIFLLNQKCYNQIDELKILRKFWLKTIHPRHLQAMRDILLTETTIDIDQHFKQEVIIALKNHYEKKLKLTQQEMKFYLPKTLKTSNIVYQTKATKTQSEKLFNQNQNYIISHQSNIPMNISINQQAQMNQANFVKRSMSPEPRMNPMNYSINVNQYNSVQPNTYYPSNQMIPRQSFHMKVVFTQYSQANIPQRVSPPIDPRDPRVIAQKRYKVQQPQIMQVQQPKIMQVQQQNIPFYPEKAEYAAKDKFKRERFYSQESKTTNGSEYLYNNIPWGPKTQVLPNIPNQIEGQPHKKVHCDESFDFSKRDFINKIEEKQLQRTEKVKHAKILEMLRGDRMFKCKQCGKGFKKMTDYDKHLNEHFEERLMIREKKKTAQRLMNLDEWTQSKSHNSLQQFDQFYITVSNLNSEEQINFQPLQLKCRLCNQTFDLKFSKDNWVLNNATFCLVNGQKIPMHKTCQQALDDSSQSENL